MAGNSQKWSEVEKDLVRASVEKMLAAPVFAASPRQQRFLDYVVRHTLAGDAERLKGYTIGVEVFDRNADFDPNLDAIVRVEAARLRSKLREYYESHGQSDAVLISLPKGSYAAEITLRDDSPAQYKPPAALPRLRLIEVENMPSLAVLPLANLGAEPEQDYFADGITDSLIFELSRLSGLFVISRQSSFAYRSSPKPSRTIAEELGVKYLLEGSVQRQGSRVRVTVQLIEAGTDGHMLSERFESDLQDIFALQDEITLGISGMLRIKLIGTEAELFAHEGTRNVAAHDALLRGLESYWKYSPPSVAEARSHFGKAAELDPEYAAAHAWLARSMLFQWIMRWDAEPGLREHAFEHARQAGELNGKSPFALAILGWSHLWCKHREPAIAACRQAVALDPNNAEALLFLSMSLSSAGFGEEALFYIEKALRLNPHSSPFYEFVLGQAYYVLEDYDRAITAYQRGCRMSDTFPPNHIYLCMIYALLGMETEMHAQREHVMSLMGGDLSKLIEPPWLHEGLAATHEHLVRLAGLLER